MKFTVPQFIDVEDKIFGPITTRQFLILLAVAGIAFITFKLVDFALFVFLVILETAFGGVVAFLRVNGQPFHFFLLNVIQTFSKPRLRVWNKELTDTELKAIVTEPPPKAKPKRLVKERVSTAKLSELSLVVNTGGTYNPDNY